MTCLSQNPATPRKAFRLGIAVVALGGLLALSTPASAQSRAPRGDGDRVEQRVAQLDEALDLTDAQASQLRALFEAQEANRPSSGARRGGSPADREAVRAEREAQRAESDRRVEAILTPAQVERYRSLRASRQSRDRQRGDGR